MSIVVFDPCLLFYIILSMLCILQTLYIVFCCPLLQSELAPRKFPITKKWKRINLIVLATRASKDKRTRLDNHY
uniref:Uncharacterized protein n=1 Tax=Arundo donax TaxID=35708 RepID=A0A0A9CEU8_ARUDO